jgi:hypothetical protein
LAYFSIFLPNCLSPDKGLLRLFSGHKEQFAGEVFEEQIALILLLDDVTNKFEPYFATSVPDKIV